ncbi:hypothetical protein [Streptomyces sp. NPDC058657]|uniref:hypothetical protein n=1 Tax=unclassified Streptomyces TaxID=2593676 RepID=UPI003663B065
MNDAPNDRLTPDAAAVLDALLDGPGAVLAALREQVPHVRVAGWCGCGCATVDLAVDRSVVAAAPPHDSPVVEGFYGESAHGAGVMLFTSEGYLSGMEIYTAADEPLTVWPGPGGLTVSA